MNEYGVQEMDILQALSNEKKRLSKEIKKSQDRLTNSAREIFEPIPKAGNRFMSVSNLVGNGMAIYEGVRMGAGVIRALSTMFRRRRR